MSASFTQYTVTITQVHELASDFNPESESQFFKTLESESESHKNEVSASLQKRQPAAKHSATVNDIYITHTTNNKYPV